MAIVQLLSWCQRTNSGIARRLNEILDVTSLQDFDGFDFERFCYLWESFSRNRAVFKDVKTDDGKTVKWTVASRYLSWSLDRVEPEVNSKYHFLDKRCIALPGQVHSNLDSSLYALPYIFVPQADNPGFDYFTMEERVDEPGWYDALLFENKLSDPTSTSQLSESAIQAKLELCASALMPSEKLFHKCHELPMLTLQQISAETIDGFNWKKRLQVRRVIVVFMCMRTIPKKISDWPLIYCKSNPRVCGVVAGRDDLLRFFGPSIASRPQFLADYSRPAKDGEKIESPKRELSTRSSEEKESKKKEKVSKKTSNQGNQATGSQKPAANRTKSTKR